MRRTNVETLHATSRNEVQAFGNRNVVEMPQNCGIKSLRYWKLKIKFPNNPSLNTQPGIIKNRIAGNFSPGLPGEIYNLI